jgi:branched-chain amino acid transport system ATP-binding protein
MLKVAGLNCFYGPVQVLRDFALDLRAGEVLCLLGRNGAGKTTALKAIMGLVRARSGQVTLDGADLTALPAHAVPKAGIGYCPQGRRLFSELTVEENLRIGLMTRGRGEATLGRVLGLFPLLEERLQQRAGTLSGGEQQMLAMARALCLEPKVLLLDEPTEGLMPSMIARILDTVRALKAQGVATILVEQRVEAALTVADRILFVENGRSRQTVSPDALRADPALLHHYVGVGLKSGKQGASQS